MLDALRLLSIKGYVPGGRIEQWEAVLSHGEPGAGRLAVIRGLLESFDWETGDTQYMLERVEQVAGSSRTESGVEPGGTAYLTAADLATAFEALDLAAEYKRDRAARCADCDPSPAELCTTCESRLARAD